MLEEEYVKYEKEEAVHKKQSHFAITPTVLIEDPYLTDKEKLLYLLMATYASKSGECFASNNRLARQLNCSMTTVSRGVSKLKDEGWIDVVMVYKEDSKEIKNRVVKFPYMSFRKKMSKEEVKRRLPDPMMM